MSAHSRSIRSKLAGVVGATVALGAAGGLAVSWIAPTAYTSTATVLVNPVAPDPIDILSADASEVDLDTEVVVASSRRVATLANQILDGVPPAGLDEPEGRIEVEGVKNTRAMRISFTADSPESAQLGAAAYASAYVAVREDILLGQLNTATARLQTRVSELTEAIAALERQEPGETSSSLEMDALIEQRTTAQRSISELRNTGTEVAAIVDPAELPDSPSSMTVGTLVASGAAIGLAIGTALALTLDAVRQRPRFGVPHSAVAEALPATDVDPGPEVVTARRSPEPESPRGRLGPARAAAPARPVDRPRVEAPSHGSPQSGRHPIPVPPGPSDRSRMAEPALTEAGERVQRLGDRFLGPLGQKVADGHLVVVTDDDHESSAALGLAIGYELARGGVRTLVMEIAALSSSVSGLAGVPDTPGLTDAVASGGTAFEAFECPGAPGLHIMPIGSARPNLMESAVGNSIRSIADRYDAAVIVAGRASWTPLFDMEVGPTVVVLGTQGPADPAALPAADRAAARRVSERILGIVSLGRLPAPA